MHTLCSKLSHTRIRDNVCFNFHQVKCVYFLKTPVWDKDLSVRHSWNIILVWRPTSMSRVRNPPATSFYNPTTFLKLRTNWAQLVKSILTCPSPTGLYCSGWVKRGPKGVILSSLNDSIETAKCMLDDINSGAMDTTKPNGQDRVLSLLAERGIKSPLYYL